MAATAPVRTIPSRLGRRPRPTSSQPRFGMPNTTTLSARLADGPLPGEGRSRPPPGGARRPRPGQVTDEPEAPALARGGEYAHGHVSIAVEEGLQESATGGGARPHVAVDQQVHTRLRRHVDS